MTLNLPIMEIAILSFPNRPKFIHHWAYKCNMFVFLFTLNGTPPPPRPGEWMGKVNATHFRCNAAAGVHPSYSDRLAARLCGPPLPLNPEFIFVILDFTVDTSRCWLSEFRFHSWYLRTWMFDSWCSDVGLQDLDFRFWISNLGIP